MIETNDTEVLILVKTKKIFSWKQWSLKLAENMLFFGLPMILDHAYFSMSPAITGLTVGTLLKQASNYLKHNRK